MSDLNKKANRPPPSDIASLPVLPLRDMMLLPGASAPLFVGRPVSLRALQLATKADGRMLLVAQRTADSDELSQDMFYATGVTASIRESIKMADGTVKAMVTADARAKVLRIQESDGALHAQVEVISSQPLSDDKTEHYLSALKAQFAEYAQKINSKPSAEIAVRAEKINDLSVLVDLLAQHIGLDLLELQRILECTSVSKRAEELMQLLESRIHLSKLERELRGKIKQQIDQNQREYYLTEQIKAAQKELGGEDDEDEFLLLRKKVRRVRMPAQAKKKALGEIKKLRMMSPMSAEATVIRNYLGWLLDLPWSKSSKTKRSLAEASTILEQQHHGLEDVKERVLEYLAVQARVKAPLSTVLCLVGPPGVGKTSLGKSIAEATGRKFVHMALGGMRDEAEIRGHRRTYIGAMPGRIVQRMVQAGVNNPLFLLDELDKLGMDYRGDPAAALLEVLDPEQNQAFNDHFLETEYDLSKVMFICTANTMNIPPALLDRLEIVRLPGYTEDEKVDIAQKHLLPKQRKLTGLAEDELVLSDEAMIEIINGHTQEAGVRELERCLGRISRKTVLHKARSESRTEEGADLPAPTNLEARHLEDYLGVKKYYLDEASKKDRIGQITGLAWTASGGDVLTIESVCIPGGSGKIIKTGSLGEVMQESVQAALTVARNCTVSVGVIEGYPSKCDIHMHIPAGSTPKDGPSAGLAMTLASVSSITQIPIKGSVAVTGEITLRGEVLRVGGLKEKLLAAKRSGISTVLLPADNQAELKEVPDNIKASLNIIGVRWIQEVWEHILADEKTLKTQIDALRNPKPPQILFGHYMQSSLPH